MKVIMLTAALSAAGMTHLHFEMNKEPETVSLQAPSPVVVGKITDSDSGL